MNCPCLSSHRASRSASILLQPTAISRSDWRAKRAHRLDPGLTPGGRSADDDPWAISTPTEHELQTGTAATDHIDNRSEDGQTHPRNRAALEAWRGYRFTKRKERQGQTMGGDQEGGSREGRGANDNAARKSLSRRSILNILKGVGAGLGAAVILGKETIVAFAQQITGVLGSPSATTTIPGNQLPPPSPKFGGVINESAKDSKPWWPPRVVPPKGAPNVLLIMTDDQGYGVSSTFGGVIPTPALDRIAAAGLRYTQFHSTALCSPTRAALITGRNHHEVGFGVITELSTGFPGYNSYFGPEHATVGTILRDNGYSTSWFGKNHNTPAFQYSAAGPFDQWPSGMGFEYFYGFMGGETDQWTPYLFRDHTQIFPWIDKPDYNLITDMADEAIDYLRKLDAVAPDEALLSLLRPRRQPLAAPAEEGVDREVQGQVRHGLERHARRDLRQPEAARRHSSECATDPVARRATNLGIADGGREEALRPAGGSVCGLHRLYRLRDRARHSAGRGHGQARQHADHLHLRRQRHESGRHAARHAQPDDRLQRHSRRARRRAARISTIRGARRRPIRIWRSRGHGPSIRHSNGRSRSRRISAARGRVWRSRGRPASRTRAASAVSSTTSSTLCRRSSKPRASRRRTSSTASGRSRSRASAWPTPSTRRTPTLPPPTRPSISRWSPTAESSTTAGTPTRSPPVPPWVLNAPMPDVIDYKWELYNLTEDYSQYNDLAAKMPEKLKEMQALFLQEAKKYNVLPA